MCILILYQSLIKTSHHLIKELDAQSKKWADSSFEFPSRNILLFNITSWLQYCTFTFYILWKRIVKFKIYSKHWGLCGRLAHKQIFLVPLSVTHLLGCYTVRLTTECFETGEDLWQTSLLIKWHEPGACFLITLLLKSIGVNTSILPQTRKSCLICR